MIRGKKIRTVLGIFALLAACSCQGKSASPSSSARQPDSSQPGSAPAAFAPLQARAALESAYRLTPDRRFLKALADVYQLVTGTEPPGKVVGAFDGTVWVVRAGEVELGKLPDLPTFADALDASVALARKLVVKRAWSLSTQKKPVDAELPFDEAAFATVTAAQTSWATGPSAQALHDAARGMVALAAQRVDTLQVADSLDGRAIATLALDKAYGSAPTARLEAMLGIALGYRAAALEAATQLPANDPVRAYLLRDDRALAAAAASTHASMWTRYLWLRRLLLRSDQHAQAEWLRLAFADHALSLPVLGMRIIDTEITNWHQIATVMPPAVLWATARAASAADAQTPLLTTKLANPTVTSSEIMDRLGLAPGETLLRFDAELARVGDLDKGPFLDAAVHRAYFRGMMFSALYEQGSFELDARSSVSSAKEWLAALKESPSLASKDFRAWFGAAIALNESSDVPAAAAQIAAPSSLGGWPRVRLLWGISKSIEWIDPRSNLSTRDLTAKLDARPQHLCAMSRIAYEILLDPVLAEKYAAAVATEAPLFCPEDDLLWAWRSRNAAALRTLSTTGEIGDPLRIRALGSLERIGQLDGPSADAEMDRILKEGDDSWPAMSAATDHAEARGRYARARSLATSWLDRHPKAPGLDTVSARRVIARTYEKEKDYPAALAAIAPAVDSWQFSAMAQAARMHSLLGQPAEAEALAARALKRYPMARAAALTALVRWRAKDNAGAAEALTQAKVQLRTTDYTYEVAPAFLQAFPTAADAADASRALDTLMAKGVDAGLIEAMVVPLRRAKAYEVGWEVVRRLKSPPSGSTGARERVMGYTLVKEWKGQAAALDYLRQEIPKPEPAFLEFYALEVDEDELAWDFVPDKGAADAVENLWLVRACTVARTKALASRRPDLMTYYSGTKGTTHYYETGKLMVGLSDEATVNALATDPRKACELAYYMGFHAQAEKRYADAIGFYRAAVEGCGPALLETQMARGALTDWKALDRTVAHFDDPE